MTQHCSSSYTIDSRSTTISSNDSSAVDTKRYNHAQSSLLHSFIFFASSSQAVLVGARTSILHVEYSFIIPIIFLARVVVLPVSGGPNINFRLSSRFSLRLNPSSKPRPLNALRSLPIRSIWFFKVIDALVHLFQAILFKTSSKALLAFRRKLFSRTFATSNFSFNSSRSEKVNLISISPISSSHRGILREGFLST